VHIITVTLQVKPAHLADFMQAMHANARESLRSEPGCRQFDVCVALDDPHRVFLYEVYYSAEAFQEHLRSPHFLAFNDATAPWLEAKKVGAFARG